MARTASEWAGEVIHSARVEEESRRQRVRICGNSSLPQFGKKKENVGCVAALMPCNNSNQRAREMRIWGTAFVFETPESWYPCVISSLICRMRVGMGGGKKKWETERQGCWRNGNQAFRRWKKRCGVELFALPKSSPLHSSPCSKTLLQSIKMRNTSHLCPITNWHALCFSHNRCLVCPF